VDILEAVIATVMPVPDRVRDGKRIHVFRFLVMKRLANFARFMSFMPLAIFNEWVLNG